MNIANREISQKFSPFVIAELSGNHGGNLEIAKELVKCAAQSGVDAIKLQTYTPETITLKHTSDDFKILDSGSIWYGKTLYELYSEAMTPWEWHEEIFKYAKSLGLIAFSSPFDVSSVEFLEKLEVPCYKIASFENTDWELLEAVASTQKPIVMSAGMASLSELSSSIDFLRSKGTSEIVILKCTSSYPAQAKDANLKTIPEMRKIFDTEIGLSDHTLGIGVSIAAVALGATVIEKHLTLSRKNGFVDSKFSLEPNEFINLTSEVKNAWSSLGKVHFGSLKSENQSKNHRRSLYFVKDLKINETITRDSVKSIRPGFGLLTKYLDIIVGKKINREIKYGEPVTWDCFG